jgi:hypothetical protein
MSSRRNLHIGGAVALAAALWALLLVPAAGATSGVDLADEDARQRDSIFITANHEFNPANGVVGGSGTRRDPFVISGWNVSDVQIQNTSKYVVIKDNVVTGRLVLDWIGSRVTLVNNKVGDLRVNQNRERTGDRTSGLIAHNTFGVVGQLRHFDGVFMHNVVGTPDDMEIPFFSEARAVNFDGFNGAHFVKNTIYGYMDATLHGHHHSSGFGKKSHYHAMKPAKKDEHAEHEGHQPEMAEEDHDHMDHTNRFHQVWISDNKIYSSNSWALRYTDTNHAANDRTASSETNEELNLPHVHHTKIHMTNNKLFGSGLMVDVFNATDEEKHTRIAHGTVDIKNNQITIEPSLLGGGAFDGITVGRAQHLSMRIFGNTVELKESGEPDVLGWNQGGSGIMMNTLDVGKVYVFDNELKGFSYGVRAANFTETVRWWVRGLKTSQVQDPLYYDNSVKRQPKTRK